MTISTAAKLTLQFERHRHGAVKIISMHHDIQWPTGCVLSYTARILASWVRIAPAA